MPNLGLPSTRERPIIFSGPMVRAILAGRKTQTRRVIKPQPMRWLPEFPPHYDAPTGGVMWGTMRGDHGTHCPYGKPGDRLWVRETHAGDNLCGWVYRADHPNADIKAGDLDDGEQSLRRWTPAIHMKREACRLVLEVAAVRVERLQAISEGDAIAEGIHQQPQLLASNGGRILFVQLWQAINEKRGFGWAANPWVWVIEFRKVKA